MKYKYRKYFVFFLFIPLGITAFLLPLPVNSQGLLSIWGTMGHKEKISKYIYKDKEQTLSVKIIENLKLKLPGGSHKLRIWIPLPATDKYQEINSLRIESPWSYSVINDPDFNNDILLVDIDNSLKVQLQANQTLDMDKPMEITWEYQVKRNEQNGFSMDEWSKVLNELFLKERGLVIIDDRIREIAKTITSNISDPLKKAKAIYDYVLNHVDYDTSVPGWGRGDVVYACDVGKGNCTDFHSLFISLARAAGIPARFRIGYPLPAETKGKLLKPYHCWAEFYVEGKGWAPVDISEAWKNPDKADYYFSNLDKDRVLISTGRNINLLPGDDKVPLANYFVKPYIELDGKSYDHFEIERSFARMEVGQ